MKGLSKLPAPLLAAALAALGVSPLSALWKNRPTLTPVERSDKLEFHSASGETVLWVDDWGRMHSPEAQFRQAAYNAWIRKELGSLFGGLSVPPDVPALMVTRQPRGKRGIDHATNKF